MSLSQRGFFLLVAIPGLLAPVSLQGQTPVRGQAHISARIVGLEELPGHCRIQTLHDLDFGSIKCGGQNGVVTLAAGGTRSSQGGVSLGTEPTRNGGNLVFNGPPSQGFNLQVQAGPILARNARGDTMQVAGFGPQVQGNLIGLGAIARIPAGQPPGHYAGQCVLHVLFQ